MKRLRDPRTILDPHYEPSSLSATMSWMRGENARIKCENEVDRVAVSLIISNIIVVFLTDILYNYSYGITFNTKQSSRDARR